MGNFDNLKNGFNEYINNYENLIKSREFDTYIEKLENYESLLNIPTLIDSGDITRIENEVLNLDEYYVLKDTIDYYGGKDSDYAKERIMESFLELQSKVEQMVFETYKEREEEWRNMGLSVVEIDELAVSFKNGTWTFTPLHIDEDESRIIAAHSCKIDLGFQKELVLMKEFDGPILDDKEKEENLQMLLNPCNNIVIKTKEELEPNIGLEM